MRILHWKAERQLPSLSAVASTSDENCATTIMMVASKPRHVVLHCSLLTSSVLVNASGWWTWNACITYRSHLFQHAVELEQKWELCHIYREKSLAIEATMAMVATRNNPVAQFFWR
jgi:hypothetical protein